LSSLLSFPLRVVVRERVARKSLPLIALLALSLAPTSPAHAVATAQAASSSASKAAAGGKLLPVIVAKATEVKDAAEVEVVGSGLALRSVTLYPASEGEVAEVPFKAGQPVRAGQVLLRLEDRKQRLAVEMASAQLDVARRLLARYENIGESGAVAGSVIDQARSDRRQAEIALAQAREALADRTVNAPISGVVGLPEVQPGDRVTTQTVVTTLDDRSRIRVAFSVPEAYLGRLKIGERVSVGNVAYPERRFEGRISRIDSRVDPVMRQVRIEATVANADDLLRPGMSFQVQLHLPGGRFIAVPELALQWDRAGAHVWAVREARAVRVPVRLVRRLQAQALVDGALRAGEAVVVEGVQRLRDGRAVEVIGSDNGDAAPRKEAR
jgi:RND family efflux transporter MFP subunit